VTVFTSAPVEAATASTGGRIWSPSFASPVVTSTSSTTPVARRGRHRGVGIGQADLLVPAGLFAVTLGATLLGLGFLLAVLGRAGIILRQHRVGVLHAEAVPRHVGADQRRVDMHHLALGNLGTDAGLHRTGKHPAEQFSAPSLTNARQRRVIRQRLVQAEAGKPAYRDLDLRLSHQPAVMHDAEQQTGQPQPHRRFWIDARPARAIRRVAASNFGTEPGQVEHPVHARENMVVRRQVAQRPRHQQLARCTGSRRRRLWPAVRRAVVSPRSSGPLGSG
jgi:hypothetical protein